ATLKGVLPLMSTPMPKLVKPAPVAAIVDVETLSLVKMPTPPPWAAVRDAKKAVMFEPGLIAATIGPGGKLNPVNADPTGFCAIGTTTPWVPTKMPCGFGVLPLVNVAPNATDPSWLI